MSILSHQGQLRMLDSISGECVLTSNRRSMKKSIIFILVLIAGLICPMTASAQYLEIEEEISQSNMPIRNADYKVIQSQPAQSSSTTSSSENLSRGYRGMVEMAHGVGTSGGNYQFKLSTTHGWQSNPYLYLGGFLSLGTCQTDIFNHRFNLRFGADFRTYISHKKVAPYLGLQLGYDHFGPIPPKEYFDEYPCVYLGGQLGVRLAVKNRRALNFSIQVGPECYFEHIEFLFKLGCEI